MCAMRIALVILVLAFAGCGKKKPAQSPATPESSQMKQDAEEKESGAPADADEAPTTRSADPQEGGE